MPTYKQPIAQPVPGTIMMEESFSGLSSGTTKPGKCDHVLRLKTTYIQHKSNMNSNSK